MQASGNLVDVDILELPRFPCCGVDIFCTSIRLVLMMMKEIDLKLTQGMAERRKTESPPDEKSWGGGQRFESWTDTKSPGLEPDCKSPWVSESTARIDMPR